MSTFADDTSVEQQGPTSFASEVVDGWDIFGRANGGYLSAIIANSMKLTSGRERVASMTTHYLCPATPGPVRIETSIIKTGRRFSSIGATLICDEKPVCESLAALHDPDPDDNHPDRIESDPPPVPPLSECVPAGNADPNEGFRPAIMDRINILVHPDDVFWEETVSGNLLMRGWVGLKDNEEITDSALLMCLDVFPPTAFPGALPVKWVPTLEMTSHVRSLPAPGPLRCAFRTRFVSGGFLEEDGELWDSNGVMVAQSRQLALAPR